MLSSQSLSGNGNEDPDGPEVLVLHAFECFLLLNIIFKLKFFNNDSILHMNSFDTTVVFTYCKLFSQD